MLCEICHKKEATIHIQEISGGQKKSMHLCSSCAAARQQGGLDLGPFNLAGLLCKLSGKAEESENLQPEDRLPEEKTEMLVCPQCSWSEKKLRESGMLGCANCYKVFAPVLGGALKSMHRGARHVGKQPAGQGSGLCVLHGQLVMLQKQLQKAVEKEDYENAAVLRDRINNLKKQCEDAASGGSGEA